MRKLRITRRRVPLARLEEYDDAWQRLRRAAGEAGARAWLFRISGRDDRMVEFLEWSDPVSVDRAEAVQEAGAALDALAPGETEDCEEADTTE
jgi:hypothetical protein